jgi:hypothetical protein
MKIVRKIKKQRKRLKMDSDINTSDDIAKDEVDPGSLSQFVAESTVRLEQFKDKVHFKLDLLISEEGKLTDRTIEVPEPFKNSFFCQAIIAHLYSDFFASYSDSTIDSFLSVIKRFFTYLTTHDQDLDNDETWANLLKLPDEDLPHNVIQQFLLHLSENSGSGSTSLNTYQLQLLKIIRWATESDTTTFKPNIENGNKLLPYISKQNNIAIKDDDRKFRLALSQLFTIDYETGEEIKPLYSDSQLITNLRWFAMWYLNIMRERRLFLREIMWDKKRTIYQVLKERIKDKNWSIEDSPVMSISSSWAEKVMQADFVEVSAMYAKIYDALLPTKTEIKKMSMGELSSSLENRLIWAEAGCVTKNRYQNLLEELPEKVSTKESVIERITALVDYNSSLHPIMLSPSTGRRFPAPGFGLKDLIVPTASEMLTMSWLLSSESVQWSNQRRLKLGNLKLLNQGKTLQMVGDETPDDVEVNTIKIGHHKGRSKDKAKRTKGRDFDTIGYKKGDPLFTTYTNWYDDLTEAQPYLMKGKGMWIPTSGLAKFGRTITMPLCFLAARESLIRRAFEKAEQELKFHSEANGEGAFQWLFSQFIKHDVYHKKNLKTSSRITLNSDSIRQSKIILIEGENISDKENAKRTAHSEQQVHEYRENGEAKERIQNGIKANVQIANKMYEESLSILDEYHLLSVEEVKKQFHTPKGITTDDVIGFINECAANPKKYDVTIFGGIMDISNPEGGIKIIKDVKSAWMMLCYINHMESELEQVKENHDEQQVVEHIVKHAQWSMLFERFPIEMQEQAKELAKTHVIPYPPLF